MNKKYVVFYEKNHFFSIFIYFHKTSPISCRFDFARNFEILQFLYYFGKMCFSAFKITVIV